MKLALRKFTKRDIAPLFAWFSSEREALQWAGATLSWPLKHSDFKALLRQHRGVEPAREVWAVDLDGNMVGHFQIAFNRRLNTAGLGRIAINPARRGEALSRPMMSMILTQAFRRPWVHRVDLMVYSHNAPAIQAYNQVGFVLEGTRRQTTPIADELWDTHIMSILRHEFDKRT